ncbi:hypothetical protein [Aeromicrobium stalagmiti]|uniref:hypothetical protein n=1 Tax=Aeromicrobium stalagmiti TaxID=2738988 RepID=UPI001568511B|nr:hypothetical protein [Aeromicrobium stalagmiti]NRQ51139.1 hypothetical protein [Aeromicrobium stalagmiti]
MDLDELLDGLLEPHAVSPGDDGDQLVAMRLADDWGVGVRLHRRGTHRQWNIREVTLRLLDHDASINGNDVRELPLGSLLSEARRLATKSAEVQVPTVRPVDLAVMIAGNGGTFGSSDEMLAALAFEYVAIVEAGDRTPSKTLAERLGGAAGTWTNRVAEARRRGFLTAVERGEAGGAVTPEAFDALP